MFETERLRLRPWRIDDLPAVFEMYSDPEVVAFLGPMQGMSLDDHRERLQKAIDHYAALDDGTGVYGCFSKADGRLVGTALLKKLPGHDLIEVGWHLARWAWGQGYATEFGREMLRHGFETLELEYVVAVVDPANDASKRVALRIGMTPTDQIFAYERTLDCFEMRQRDWLALRPR